MSPKSFAEQSYFFCPISHMIVSEKIFLPNRRIKEAIADFYVNNPWALEYKANEDYRAIDIIVE